MMAGKRLKEPPISLFRSAVVAGLVMATFRGTAGMPGPQDMSGIFTDVTESVGITWTHFNGESPDAHLIETKNGGAAFLDFDQDGLLDVFLVNGGETPRGKSPTPVRNALYRNLGNGKFEEVAAKAGVDRLSFYGIGVAVGDYDNDGYPDLLVTGYPERALFHNNRDGTFSEVAGKAGLKGSGRWSTGAAWFDYDRDGWLDLVICHYAQMSFDSAPRCEFRGTAHLLCSTFLRRRRAIDAVSQQRRRDFRRYERPVGHGQVHRARAGSVSRRRRR